MPHPIRRRQFCAGTAAALALGFPMIGRTQAHPLTILLTVPPGNSADTLARLLGEHLRARLRRPVVVESRSGAGGLVAIQDLRNYAADGSWLLMAPDSAVALLPLFTSKPIFDYERDLMPVVECASAPMALTVHALAGWNSLRAYFDSVRLRAELGSIGVPSPVSVGALVIYELGKQLNLPLQAIAYRGGTPLLADLLGRQIPASGSLLPDSLQLHRAGKLKILAHASATRSVLAPEIPTFAQAGFPGYVAVTSFGLYGRAGMSTTLAADYAAIVSDALATPQVSEALHRMGFVPEGGTPAEFNRKVLAERERWAPIVKASGIRMDA